MGIWVIAVPKSEPPTITFPEKQEVPNARLTGELDSDAPPVDTAAAALTEKYISPVSSQQTVTPTAPAIATDPIALAQNLQQPRSGQGKFCVRQAGNRHYRGSAAADNCGRHGGEEGPIAGGRRSHHDAIFNEPGLSSPGAIQRRQSRRSSGGDQPAQRTGAPFCCHARLLKGIL